MRRRAAYAVAAAAIATTGAFGATIAKDPGALVLRKADFPRGATYETNDYDDTGIQDAIAEAGLSVDAASYYGLTYSKAKGALTVTGVVLTTRPAAARKAFAIAKSERDAFWRISRGARPITLPRYGDQQYARYSAADAAGIGVLELLVRKRTTVWLLNVNFERRPPAPKAELLAQLTKYATKQKRRIGNG